MRQAALVQLIWSLVIEWVTSRFTLNAIGSGSIPDSLLLPDDDTELQWLQRFISTHRLEEPENLAALTIDLASNIGGDSTGQTMSIEGRILSHP